MLREAVLIFGLVVGGVMFLLAAIGTTMADGGDGKDLAESGFVGVRVAILWFGASVLVVRLPRLATALFLVGGAHGLAISAGYPDMAVWGAVSFALAAATYYVGVARRPRRGEPHQTPLDRRRLAKRVSCNGRVDKRDLGRQADGSAG